MMDRVSAEQPIATYQSRSPASKPSHAPESDKINKIRALLVEMFEDNDRKVKEAVASGRLEDIKQLTKDKLSHNANDRVALSTETFNENQDPAKVSSSVERKINEIAAESTVLDQKLSELSRQIPPL